MARKFRGVAKLLKGRRFTVRKVAAFAEADPLEYAVGHTDIPADECDYDEQTVFEPEAMSPLEDALGCRGLSVFDGSDNKVVAERDMGIFGFEDEDPLSRALAEIGTNILVAAALEADEEDVGVIVPVSNSDAQDYGMMVNDLISATSVFELQEILDNYRDMPGAKELAEACAAKFGAEGLRLVV